MDQAPDFVRCDAGDRASVAAIFPLADFDEHQVVAIAHDKIDFTALDAIVPFD